MKAGKKDAATRRVKTTNSCRRIGPQEVLQHWHSSLARQQDRKGAQEAKTNIQKYGAVPETASSLWFTHTKTYPKDAYVGPTTLS